MPPCRRFVEAEGAVPKGLVVKKVFEFGGTG